MNPIRISFTFISVVLLSLFAINGSSQEYGCTTFSLSENQRDIFGRNLDTETEFGYVFINKRDVSKVAYFDSTSTESRAIWTSIYGSITFNQISCDIPHGGINEKGLVVEHMYYGSSNYPPTDGRQSLISHQWIQYILDNCETVAEAINTDALIRISDAEYKFPIHFHLMDSTGDRAIIEFISDTYTVYTGANYTACALANSSYSYSLTYLSNFIGWGGATPIPVNVSSSTDRFVKAADMVKNYPGSSTIPLINYGFSVLDSVWENTKWQLIYDIDSLSINYKLLSDPTIRTIYLSDFDFGCNSGTEMLEIGDDPSNGSNWLTFSTALNTYLINSSCSLSGFVNTILGTEADDIAVYPETSSCTTTSQNQYYIMKQPNLYPNPTTGIINIEFDNIKKIEIINQQGQLVLTSNDNKNVDISEKPNGIYFIKITTDDMVISLRIIKQ
ncbi:MAG TPA: linear amide C-N hydrolase [Bacteroidales bacterium]|nr:linear amide C-N hydrolase [Bacteroidales bacterium]